MADSDALYSGKRCLVLEDEVLIALDLQDFLESLGLEVICANNAADALAALHGAPSFDLGVLDVKLSGTTRSSLTVASALAQTNTPFIFVTGVRTDDSEIARFPSTPVVEKPYEPSLLLGAIRRALRPREDDSDPA